MLEVTESAIMADSGLAMELLTGLSRMGVALSIDDFGTGYSSLAYLKRLPVDEIKIDKSFVRPPRPASDLPRWFNESPWGTGGSGRTGEG